MAPKNGKTAAAAPAANAAPRAAKVKKTFLQLLNVRLDKAEKLVKAIGKQLKKASQPIEPMATALQNVTHARTFLASIPADFAPKRAVVAPKVMEVGSMIEIAPDRRARFQGILLDSVINGTFKVTAYAPASGMVQATSTVDASKSPTFIRRDVQLQGTEAKTPKTDAEKAAAKAKRAAAKAEKAKLAQGAQA